MIPGVDLMQRLALEKLMWAIFADKKERNKVRPLRRYRNDLI